MADALTVARFFTLSQIDRGKTEKEGRPIYRDVECVEIMHPGDKLQKKVFPAHEVWKRQVNETTGAEEPITYAMRFPAQYQAFKENKAQSTEGTPIEELPFLTQGKRLELKALHIFTAEALAALDGQRLKQIGMGGRELKDQAQAYLDAAKSSADVTKLAAENARLKEQIDALSKKVDAFDQGSKAGEPKKTAAASAFADMDADAIKEWIKDATGSRPAGNPSHATLVKLADEINADLKAKKDAESKADA